LTDLSHHQQHALGLHVLTVAIVVAMFFFPLILRFNERRKGILTRFNNSFIVYNY